MQTTVSELFLRTYVIMKRINLILGIMILWLAGNANAQNMAVTAVVNANKVGQKDQLTVTYTATNIPDLKDMPVVAFHDFDVLGGPFQSNNTSISIVNNRMTQNVNISMSYVLHPKHTGKLTIPAGVAVDNANHTYLSNKVDIEVVPGSLAPAQQRQRSNDPFADPNYDPWAARMQQIQRQQQAMMQQMQAARGQQQPQQAPAAMAAADQKAIGKDIFIKVTVDKSKVHVV